MAKKMFAICTAFLLFVVFGVMSGEAALNEERYIGLHDRLLKFGQSEIILIDGKAFVPFVKLMDSFYATVVYNDKIYASKNDHEVMFDYEAGKTFKDGKEIKGMPIRTINGRLFADVSFIAESYGFYHEYFPELGITRIFSDNFKSMNSKEYSYHMKVYFDEMNALTLEIPRIAIQEKPKKANVYLTFDDGPNRHTTANAATLRRYNVQGSFFFLGYRMNANPTIVKSVANDGNYIGSHSMTHEFDKVYQSTKSFIDEMNGAAELIHKITGQEAKLLRVPYGSKPYVTRSMKSELNKFGYKLWDWDVDSNDWRYTNEHSAEIVENVQKGVEKAFKSGKHDIVVLLHDYSATTKALSEIIEWLQQEDYEIKKYEADDHVIQNFLHDPTL